MSKSTAALPWRDDEIVRHYQAAKDKDGIITILAQLNAVDTPKIKQILKRNGVNVYGEVREVEREREGGTYRRKKETKPRKPKVYIVLEHDGVAYSIDDIVRKIGRSPTYIKARLVNVDAVTFGGIEYKILRYEKWGKNRGLSGKITTGTEEP